MELVVQGMAGCVVKFNNTFVRSESEGEASYLRKRLLCRPPLTNLHPTPTKLDPADILSLVYPLATYILCKFEYITSLCEAHLHLQVLISEVLHIW
jgi:hypothetical protein